MDLLNGPILVIGATGQQGGAVARELLRHGFIVRALTRDVTQPAADVLRRLGAQVIHGDLDQIESLEHAMHGCRGVFSVQNFWKTGAELEIEQGIRVAEVVHTLNIPFMVYSSVGGAERSSNIPHFETKFVIEGRISELRLKAAVLRPVWFMENFFRGEMLEGIRNGVLAIPLPPDVPLQMIAVDDIGFFAAQAFKHPGEHTGKALEIAGDELTMPEVAKLLSRRLEHPVDYQQVPMDQVRAKSEENARMFEWFIKSGYQADIEHLRVIHPALLRFEQWLNVVEVPEAAAVSVY
ncbi:MAG: NmrA/HSCARG family protein [Armatimonadia bacterium]